MEKGVLTKQEERWLARFLDSVLKLKGVWELVDGPGFRVLIAIADNHVVEQYVKAGHKNILKELVKFGIARDKAAIAGLIAEKANIQNPVLVSMGESAVNFLMSAVYEYVDNVDTEAEDVE